MLLELSLAEALVISVGVFLISAGFLGLGPGLFVTGAGTVSASSKSALAGGAGRSAEAPVQEVSIEERTPVVAAPDAVEELPEEDPIAAEAEELRECLVYIRKAVTDLTFELAGLREAIEADPLPVVVTPVKGTKPLHP